ncbi:MAG: hypothetical protein ACRDK8_07565 [Solirubrobacteraceae bacterium]
MALVIVINAFLCLDVLITIVGWYAWVIVSSDREALSTRSRAQDTGLLSSETSSEGRAVTQS